jgi:dihydrofolate reductase
MDLGIIVAIADNKVIGNGNSLPWKIPADMIHFKEKTMGHPVILGSRTFKSILDTLGKPLPGRYNIVLSSNSNYSAENAHRAANLEEAIEIAKARNTGLAWIAGGKSVYEEALRRSDLNFIELTEVHMTAVGDVYFPEIDWKGWSEIERKDFEKYSFVKYERKQNG